MEPISNDKMAQASGGRFIPNAKPYVDPQGVNTEKLEKAVDLAADLIFEPVSVKGIKMFQENSIFAPPVTVKDLVETNGGPGGVLGYNMSDIDKQVEDIKNKQ